MGTTTAITTLIIIMTFALLAGMVGAFSPARMMKSHRCRSASSRLLTSRTGTTLEMATRATATARSNKRTREVSQELLELFNAQVTHELSASQLYLSASIWCEQRDLVGMAAYMRRESDEERSHALDFIDFANKRNIPIQLENLEAPDMSWSTVEELWEDVLQAEVENTASLLEMGDAAAECRDHAMSTFLQPYHMEQVNSEDHLGVVLAKVRDENKTPGLIRQLDTELGQEAISHQN